MAGQACEMRVNGGFRQTTTLSSKIIIRAGLVLFRSSKLQSAGNLSRFIAGTVGFRQFTLLFTPCGAVERGCEWGLIFERNFKFLC